MLTHVISGGQTGADQAGLSVAKLFRIETGGYAPKGWMTKNGSDPTLRTKYNLRESTGGYSQRTYLNVMMADGTIRLALNFNTPGEVCTLNAITTTKKPYFDVNLKQSLPSTVDCCEWIIRNDIKILNIAGNTEIGSRQIFLRVSNYLTDVFRILSKQNLIKRIGE